MVAGKSIKKQNKNLVIKKPNKIKKISDETQKKRQVAKVKKAVNDGLVKVPEVKSPVKKAIDKKELPAAKQTKSKPSSTALNAKTQEEKEAKMQATVFVGNLKFSATDEKLRELFSKCGEIEYIKTLQSPGNKGCKGVAYVCFKNADVVPLAIELRGIKLDGRPINVERYSMNKGLKLPKDEFKAKMQDLGKKYVREDRFKEKMKRIGKKYIGDKAGDNQETENQGATQNKLKAKMQRNRMQIKSLAGQFVKNPDMAVKKK